jgi:hypothetical protein
MTAPQATLVSLLLGAFVSAWAQAPSAGQSAPDRQKRMMASQPQPAPKDDPSFKAIFDGKALTGWEGDLKHWRVENGSIVGETTAENPLKTNTFLIWRGGSPKDFELKLEYRLSAQGNSGVQYRSEAIPNRPFGLRGYQADIDSENRYTGQIYEEGGRGFLALRGQINRIDGESQSKMILGSVGDSAQLASLLKKEAWNEVHIIARGNTLIQILNGQVMSALIDDDPSGRRPEGVIGFQLHVGPPMKIDFRNIRLKNN